MYHPGVLRTMLQRHVCTAVSVPDTVINKHCTPYVLYDVIITNSAERPADRAFAAFCFFLFVVYGLFAAMLAVFR
jgi:hypothetical protein